MKTLSIKPNLSQARFGLKKTRLFSNDEHNCSKCPLRSPEAPVFKLDKPAKIPPGKRLMVISDRPAYSFSALSELENKSLKAALNNVSFDYVYVTTMIKCIPKKNALKNQIEECEWRLRQEIEDIRPDVIVATGRTVASVFNISGTTEEVRNQVYEVASFDWKPKLIVTYPFSKIFEDPRYERQFHTDIVKAERFAFMENAVQYDYKMFESPEEFGQWVDTLLTHYENTIIVAADIETTGLDPRAEDAKVRSIAFSWAEGKGRGVPYELDIEGYRPHLKRLLESNVKFVFHNAVFDMQYLLVSQGIEVKNLIADTMIMAYLVDPLRSNFKLKSLSQEYTELGAYDTEVKGTGFIETDIETLITYNICDSDATLRIWKIYNEETVKLGMVAINQILAKAIYVLMDMHRYGVLIDQDFVQETIPKLEAKLAEYEADLKELAGDEYDWNSTYDVEHILYDEMKLPRPNSMKATATDDDCLDRLNTPFTDVLRKYRKGSKLLNTYFKGYFSKVDADGRLRATYHITRTRTGRLSSTDPNYQNLPRKMGEDDFGYDDFAEFKVKNAVISEPGWILLAADQSQVELRVAAIVSQDPTLCKVYLNNLDVHSMNCKAAFGTKIDLEPIIAKMLKDGFDPEDKEKWEIELLRRELKTIKYEHPEQRTQSKSVSFGTLYGMGAQGLKFDLDSKTRRKGKEWTIQECQAQIDSFHATYPVLSSWLRNTQRQAKKDAYVTTLFGRRRPLPGMRSNDWYYKSKAKREAINTPIQATASDIMLLGISNIRDQIDRTRARIVATVHDSVVLEVREDYVEEATKIMLRCLENPLFNGMPLPFINIPLKAEAEKGYKYGSMEEI